MTVNERIEALRRLMEERNIAIYVVPTADFHESEYVGEHFKARAFITGFTGSAGTAVITMTEAGLWTDGRYFVQARQQLAGTTVTLYPIGEDGVPTVEEFVKENLKEGQILGFDGRVLSGRVGREFEEIVQEKKGGLSVEEDLIDLIWEERPALSCAPVWLLEESYTGESTESKLAAVRKVMEEKKATVHLLSSLYDIAWLLNVRGGDISYVPVVLSYLAVTKDSCIWFLQEEALHPEGSDKNIGEYLCGYGIVTRPYGDFYAYVKALPDTERILLDSSVVNYRICCSIPKEAALIDEPNPTELMKAVKNPVEIENIRKAHLKDAVAMCKFMYWLKINVGKIPMTEISVSDHLEELRRQQEGFLELSFDTISGYGEHGAIVHYSATSETDAALLPEGLLLVDSGGHYLEGTTDITRTFALGPVTEEMREDFTRVCRSNINLASVRFMKGCTGRNLDIIAREPLWEVGKDYNHGTGHGVGYVLNVHEGPNSFRWRQLPGQAREWELKEGMVTTDEPGIYIEGKYGIRTENELICQTGEKNGYGQFMYFENVTYVPIDLDALDPGQMTETERRRLNEYHALVYEKVAPYLTKDEAEFLRKYTSPI